MTTTKPMVISFLTELVATLLVAWLLASTTGLRYLRRVAFGVVTELPAWNWFGFDTMFTLVAIADLVIGWFLAGLFMAMFIHGRAR